MNKKLCIATLTIELFQVHMTVAKSGGGKTSELLNALHPGKELWRIITSVMEHSTGLDCFQQSPNGSIDLV